MLKSSTLPMEDKIKSWSEIQETLEKDRKKGLRIIHCHGVFDLLHPGHVRHFRAAKAQGDKLVVTVTPDRFVNKGPDRPVFSEMLRLESIASLQDVDYVVLNDSSDAVTAIRKIRPTLYVKGIEYAEHAADVTGKISEEVREVEEVGGSVFYTNDIVFSSSSLLNRYFGSMPSDTNQFLTVIKNRFSLEKIVEEIESLKNLRVLIIGDSIIDEYQYVDPIGQSGKGHHLVAKCLDKEVFLGGALIIANHVSQFSDHVSLLTCVGKECPYLSFIKTSLDPKVNQKFLYIEEASTLVKKRYVLKDGKTLSKLFETYSGLEKEPEFKQTCEIVEFLSKESKNFDLILVADFGNGFTNSQMIQAISEVPTFLAVNTQTNSGNRGYNVITNYQRADYISLNEPELRLATHNKTSSLEGLASDIAQIMHCPNLSITRGINGVFCVSDTENPVYIPAFTTQSIDRIGAGDAYFSLSSLYLSTGAPILLSGFVGTLAAAMSVQMVGNQEPIKKSSLIKYLIRLMK